MHKAMLCGMMMPELRISVAPSSCNSRFITNKRTNMLRNSVAAVLLIVGNLLSSAQARELDAIKGMPYGKAREIILQAGWTPVEGDRDMVLVTGHAGVYDEGFREADSCSVDGWCKFIFKNKKGQTLDVSTYGEALRYGDIPVAGFNIKDTPNTPEAQVSEIPKKSNFTEKAQQQFDQIAEDGGDWNYKAIVDKMTDEKIFSLSTRSFTGQHVYDITFECKNETRKLNLIMVTYDRLLDGDVPSWTDSGMFNIEIVPVRVKTKAGLKHYNLLKGKYQNQGYLPLDQFEAQEVANMLDTDSLLIADVFPEEIVELDIESARGNFNLFKGQCFFLQPYMSESNSKSADSSAPDATNSESYKLKSLSGPLANSIARSLSENWHPVNGGLTSLSVTVQVELSRKGLVSNVFVIEPSGNERFDSSAMYLLRDPRHYAEVKNIDNDTYNRYYSKFSVTLVDYQ